MRGGKRTCARGSSDVEGELASQRMYAWKSVSLDSALRSSGGGTYANGVARCDPLDCT